MTPVKTRHRTHPPTLAPLPYTHSHLCSYACPPLSLILCCPCHVPVAIAPYNALGSREGAPHPKCMCTRRDKVMSACRSTRSARHGLALLHHLAETLHARLLPLSSLYHVYPSPAIDNLFAFYHPDHYALGSKASNTACGLPPRYPTSLLVATTVQILLHCTSPGQSSLSFSSFTPAVLLVCSHRLRQSIAACSLSLIFSEAAIRNVSTCAIQHASCKLALHAGPLLDKPRSPVC